MGKKEHKQTEYATYKIYFKLISDEKKKKKAYFEQRKWGSASCQFGERAEGTVSEKTHVRGANLNVWDSVKRPVEIRVV